MLIGVVGPRLLTTEQGGCGRAASRSARPPRPRRRPGRPHRSARANPCTSTQPRLAGAQDIDARDDGPEAVSLPADQREHRAGGEEDEAPTAIENALTGITGEAQPEFDLIPIETPTGRWSEAPARSLLAFQAIPVWYSRHPFRALPEGGKDARTMEPSLSQCAFL